MHPIPEINAGNSISVETSYCVAFKNYKYKQKMTSSSFFKYSVLQGMWFEAIYSFVGDIKVQGKVQAISALQGRAIEL